MQDPSEGFALQVRIVGNYTEPHTQGEYRNKHGRGSPTSPFGKNPVRQLELENEFGNAELLALYRDPTSARQHTPTLTE